MNPAPAWTGPVSWQAGAGSTARRFNYGVAFLMVLVLVNGLGAYSVGGIPMQWIGNIAALAVGGALLVVGRETLPGTATLIALLAYCATLNLLSLFREGSDRSMPPLATTDYLSFIGLRYATFGVFLVVATLTYFLARRGRAQGIANGVTMIAVLLSLFAVYVYLAHVYGLPEPERSRMGTGGGEQAVRFSYQFHRAMGSFREPSHLAEWLIGPLYLSLLGKGRHALLPTTIISLTLVLSGSLTGLLSAGLGFLLALLWCRKFNATLRLTSSSLIPALVAAILFTIVAVSYSDAEVSLSGTLWKRVEPILASGSLRNSNRASVYNYLDAHPPTVFGVGLGNSNLDYGTWMNSAIVTSFLSLYWNILYSAGWPGAAMLALFLTRPLRRGGRTRRSGDRTELLLTAAYFSYLIAFVAHTEELPVQFALLTGLLAAHRRKGVSVHGFRVSPV